MKGRTFRYVLTIALLYGIYTETGPFTTLLFFLMFLKEELQLINKEMSKKTDDLIRDAAEKISKAMRGGN